MTFRIIVESETHKGKSAVAQYISEKLREAGIDTSYCNPEHPPREPERLRQILGNLRGQKVEVIERQLPHGVQDLGFDSLEQEYIARCRGYKGP